MSNVLLILLSVDLFSHEYSTAVNNLHEIVVKIKFYSLHWQPKWLNCTIRTLWLITNSLMYISKTIYESITIYESVTN